MVIGSGITIGTGIQLTPSNTPLPGTPVPWSNNSYFNLGSAQSGITTNLAGIIDTNAQMWQLCYAWQSITVANGLNTLGFNPYYSEGNALVTFNLAVASTSNSTDFSNASTYTLTYTPGFVNLQAGVYVQNNGVFPGGAWAIGAGAVTIPANRYFLLGMYWPLSRTYQTTAQNKTAYVGSSPYVTALNTVYIALNPPVGGWPSPNSFAPLTVPLQLGGPGYGFGTLTNTTSVMSAVFSYN